MDRRTFMKLLGGLASMPIVGRIAKPLKSETVQEGIASVSEGGMKLYQPDGSSRRSYRKSNTS